MGSDYQITGANTKRTENAKVKDKEATYVSGDAREILKCELGNQQLRGAFEFTLFMKFISVAFKGIKRFWREISRLLR